MKAPLTVQDILDKLAVARVYEYRRGQAGQDPTTQEVMKRNSRLYLDEATNHLYQAMQEVIGSNENSEGNKPHGDVRNQLRSEQRTRLNKLFGRGE